MLDVDGACYDYGSMTMPVQVDLVDKAIQVSGFPDVSLPAPYHFLNMPCVYGLPMSLQLCPVFFFFCMFFLSPGKEFPYI